ncbi:hypothetical protein [Dehalogenimonas etheniformans]|uniref:Uncharacterized protein n=1 Tax=Dehalogenimonas etheniformans TaxID=1536648 RepID=A0A2P5PA72_9CHLR|nr:hypothetical protein [Dehalogenimonas etheniformans]PPD59174.1 hypothetical protein JP09_000395 [Dehalogenimonas etheniformans]QNT75785.1 hypothetical protein HX448_03325 [Dehalogenimonas etheniformans]
MPHSYEKRLEVSLLYVFGYTYKEIEDEADVSHGSINDIVGDLKSGDLKILGIPMEEVVTLRQVSVEINKKGLQPAQALLGGVFFKRCLELGIEPASLDLLGDLVKKFAPGGFPAQDFFKVAFRLHTLEQSEGTSYTELGHKLDDYQATRGGLQKEISSLQELKAQFIAEETTLETDKVTKQLATNQAQAKLETLTSEIETAKGKVAKEQAIQMHLKAERQDLAVKNQELAAQLGAKQAALAIINKTGFSEIHLFQLRNCILELAADKGTSPEVFAD